MERLFEFAGGDTGAWRVDAMRALTGAPLPAVSHVAVLQGGAASSGPALWSLRGVTSNERYVRRDEKRQLADSQPALGRATATHAALIPLRKSAAWWLLGQDERREIIEEQSHHIRIGMAYLPAIARRLFHCRDLGGAQPFDFLTWFEYAPADAARFDDLLAQLRATLEWTYVEREAEIRLVR